jgi:hypothetical protein
MQMNAKRKHGGNRSVQIATGIPVVAAVPASFTIWFQGESVLAQGQTSSAVFLPDRKPEIAGSGKVALPRAFCQRCLRLARTKSY